MCIVNLNTGLKIITLGIVDTGADCCSIPAEMAKMLGHNLDAEEVTSKKITTAGGEADAYEHTFRIDILDFDKDKKDDLGALEQNIMENPDNVLYTIEEAQFDCVVGLDFVLLGQRHFLCDFVVTIHYPENYFSIEYPEPVNQ